ncbi:hypothetical protein ACH5RR_039861 [Cinchona calisaya]|uniref:Uncharacterized protein n=1 Tax=Cinchona calisaya TaxID=153742 RepID=A0ABD2Y0R4_9GENT
MGNIRKASNSTALVESGVVHPPSNKSKIINKTRVVRIEAKMFHDKLALIASPCLERGIDFYGQGTTKLGTWEPPLLAILDYVFRRPRTKVGLHSLVVYHRRSLHVIHHKFDILSHHLNPVHSLNMASWPPESDTPRWHFGLPDDEFDHGSEESDREYTGFGDDDGVGSSGHS